MAYLIGKAEATKDYAETLTAGGMWDKEAWIIAERTVILESVDG